MNKVYTRTIVPEVRKDEESRKVTFVASDGTRDTAGTVLNQEGWDLERFNANGIIGYQHKVYGGWDDTDNPDNVIGKGHAYLEDGKLMVDIEFEPKEINELAEKVYQKILFGSLRAVSVGFLPKGHGSWGKGEEAVDGSNPTYYFEGQELLEVSVVNIPANPNALKKAFEAEAEEVAQFRQEEVARQEAEKPREPETPEEVAEEPEVEAKQAIDEAELQRTLTVAEATSLL